MRDHVGFLQHLVDIGAIDAATQHRVHALAGVDSVVAVIGRLGLVGDADLAAHLAGFHDLPLADANLLAAGAHLPTGLPASFLRKHRVLPLMSAGAALRVAMADPGDVFAQDAVKLATGRGLDIVVAPATALDAALDQLIPAAGGTSPAMMGPLPDDSERLRDLAGDAPAVRLLEGVLAQAVAVGASDIHLEPAETSLQVRFRVDGVLRPARTLPQQAHGGLIGRVKVLAKLDLGERRLPQDGRTRLAVEGRPIDIRVAVTPTLHGESAVLRLLDRARAPLNFAALGFDELLLGGLFNLLDRPHGVVLVTGPTGSGKTTTLYAALDRMNRVERKILTVEDPIEYALPGINQIQVNPRIGLDFADTLRALLRHDPDVLMVGEIRDLETARTAIQAALTGHLVLSTLHTNGAAASLARLLDMGTEAYLLASAINGVVAQRLVRTLCAVCKYWDEAVGFWQARGCAACAQTGYRGRTVLAELMVMNDVLRAALRERPDAATLEALAKASGLVGMRDQGLAKARAGVTSLDEVLRVTG